MRTVLSLITAILMAMPAMAAPKGGLQGAKLQPSASLNKAGAAPNQVAPASPAYNRIVAGHYVRADGSIIGPVVKKK